MKKHWENEGAPNEQGDYVAVVDMEDGSRPSRFIGKTAQAVADAIMDSYAAAVTDMQKSRREARARLKPDAPPAELQQVNVKPLSPDEAFQFATNDLTDPAKVHTAVNRLVEASIGVPLSRVKEVVGATRDEEARQYFFEEAEAFKAETPDYYVDPTNLELLFNWLEKNNMQPTRNNLSMAFEDLSSRSILIKAPTDGSTTTQQPGRQQQEPNTPAQGTNPPANVRPRLASVSTGIRSSDANASAPAPIRPKTITRSEIEAMPRHEYAEKLRNDPAFRRSIDATV